MDVPPLPSSLWWDETPSVGGSGGGGRGGVAAIRENMTHSVGGEFFALRAVTVAIFPHNRSSTHGLALPLPRLRFDYGVTRKVQAAPQYAERGRSNGALPPATLAAEEDGGG